jgi:hypothetical protein
MITRPKMTYLLTLIFLAAAAATLFILNANVLKTGQAHTFSQAIGEALIVALVVAIAVEPRLLRHFGEEIASKSFWTSFYARAPEEYRNAIQNLARETQFTHAIRWRLSFDWIDDNNHDAIKLTITVLNFRKNCDTNPYKVTPYAFAYESRFHKYPTKFIAYTIYSESLTRSIDILLDKRIQPRYAKDGRLEISDKTEIFTVQPDQSFTTETRFATCVDTIGYYPLTVTRPTLCATVQLMGTALNDLFISILHPGSGTLQTNNEGVGTELEKQGEIRVGEVYITGQAVLVSWKVLSSEGQS